MTSPAPVRPSSSGARSSSVGRYVRAVFGLLVGAGGVVIGVIEGIAAIRGTPPNWQGVALVVICLAAAWLMVDPSAPGEIVAGIRAWKGTSQ